MIGPTPTTPNMLRVTNSESLGCMEQLFSRLVTNVIGRAKDALPVMLVTVPKH